MINIRNKEHLRYIENNKPQSTYALNILKKGHEYRPLEETMQLENICTKGLHMNSWEDTYIVELRRKYLLVTQQHQIEQNIIFDVIQTTTPPQDNHCLLHA